MSHNGIAGTVAVVTGAAGGIGRSVAARLAAEDAVVAAADVDTEGLASLVGELHADGYKAERYTADVCDSAAVEALFDAVERDLGPIAHTVNVAGVLATGDVTETPDDRWEHLFSVNTAGVFHISRAAATAEATVAELSRRARRVRPVRGRVASFVMHRARELAGMREMAKFAWLIPLAEMRRQLLLAGAELAGQRLLEAPEDIMFLDPEEARAAADHGMDRRALVAERKAHYTRELRRRHVPVAMLSDGTDAEALAPPPPAVEGTLTGAPAAAGRATGRARVVVDPVGARIEPGEILVAPTTDPGWTPLFMTAAGLVTETGSVVAHGPTVAREYGIPAVICLPGATQRIATGDVITIDGATGRVVLEPEE